MKFKKSYMLLLFTVAGLASACEDVFEPAPENKSELAAIYDSPRRAQGLIGQVYSMINGVYPTTPQSDLATDDAVSNKTNNAYSVMAQGGWKSDFNPLSRWDICYSAINYCNIFLDNADKITWVKDYSELNKYYSDRFKADAFQGFQLLVYHFDRHFDRETAVFSVFPLHFCFCCLTLHHIFS